MGASGGAPAGASGGAPRALRGFFGAAHGERRARGGGGREEAKRPEAVGQEGRRAARWPSRAARAHLGVDHADLEAVLERQLAETSPDARGHAREGYGQV